MSAEVAKRLEPWSELNGKVVMVTGASSGIGKDMALDMANAGCKIVAVARRLDRLKSLCDEINQLGSNSEESTPSQLRAVPIELDISSDGETIEAAVQKAWDAFGRIDALINNAGVRGNYLWYCVPILLINFVFWFDFLDIIVLWLLALKNFWQLLKGPSLTVENFLFTEMNLKSFISMRELRKDCKLSPAILFVCSFVGFSLCRFSWLGN